MGGRGPVTWAHGVRDGPVLGRLLGGGAAEQGRRASIPSGDTASAAARWPGTDQGKRGIAESRHTGPSCTPLSEVILGLDCLVQRSRDLPPLHRVGCVHGGTRGTVCSISALDQCWLGDGNGGSGSQEPSRLAQSSGHSSGTGMAVGVGGVARVSLQPQQ